MRTVRGYRFSAARLATLSNPPAALRLLAAKASVLSLLTLALAPFANGATTFTLNGLNTFGTRGDGSIQPVAGPGPSDSIGFSPYTGYQVRISAPGATNAWFPGESTQDARATGSTNGFNMRGIACDPVSGNVILVDTHLGAAGSVGGGNVSPYCGIYVLDPNSGQIIGGLSTNMFGGTYTHVPVGVADDGVVYVANQTTASQNNPFKIYRWLTADVNNPTFAFPPTGAFANTIGTNFGTSGERIGQSMDVRGSGTNTLIILGTANINGTGTNVFLFDTADGVNFAAHRIAFPPGLITTPVFNDGIAFGPGNTFWAKQVGKPLLYAFWDTNALASGSNQISGAIISSFAASSVADPLLNLAAITYDPVNKLLAGLEEIGGTATGGRGKVWLFHVPDPANHAPAILASRTYLPNFQKATAPMGYLHFGANGTRLYANVVNNGILASTVDSTNLNPPTFTTDLPASTRVLDGTTAHFEVFAVADVTNYVWYSNNVVVPGANAYYLDVLNVGTNQSGVSYKVVASNAAGSSESVHSTLTILRPGNFFSPNLLWSKTATGTPLSDPTNFVTSTGGTSTPNERTIAYHALSNQLLVVRGPSAFANLRIFALNAHNGTFLYNLKTNGITTSGALTLCGIGVADDGAVYAASVSGTGSSDQSFKVYRWADSGSNTLPVVIFGTNSSATASAGNPYYDLLGSLYFRSGDNLAVHGAGNNTEIIVDSQNSSKYAAILRPNGDGTMTNWTQTGYQLQNVQGSYGSEAYGTTIGRSLQFGSGATFWQKRYNAAAGAPLAEMSYNVGGGTAPLVIANSSAEAFTNGPMAVNSTLGLAAGINFVGAVNLDSSTAPDVLDYYHFTDPSQAVVLSRLNLPGGATNGFHKGNANGIGQVLFGFNPATGTNYLFVIDANNGVAAYALVGGVTPAPKILAQPHNLRVLQGGNGSMGVVLDQPLTIHWYKGTNSPADTGVTGSTYNLTNAQPTDAGDYFVIATSISGSVTSQVAHVTVGLPTDYYMLSQLWAATPGSNSFPYVSSDGGANTPNERAFAYNALSNQLIVVRCPPASSAYSVFVVDAASGAFLYTLNTNGIQHQGASEVAGSNPIDLLGAAAADDGAIYICSESPNASGGGAGDSTKMFRVYRWANTDPSTAPVNVFTGDPSSQAAGLNFRWGDVLTARGSGTNTELFLNSLDGSYGAVLKPTDGTLNTFANYWFTDAAGGGSMGRSVQFGTNSTVFEKRKGAALVKSSYNLANNSSALLLTIPSSDTLGGVWVDSQRNLMAGVDFVGANGSKPDAVALYDITDPSSPMLLNRYNFPVNQNPNANVVCQTIIAGNRLWSLDANNGLVAFNLVSPTTNYSVVFPAGKSTFFANHLDHLGGNNLSLVFPGPYPDGTTAFAWNNGFLAASWDTDANEWTLDFLINPGGGAVMFAQATFTNTFIGTAHTPSLPVSLNPGQKYLLSDQTLEVGTWETIIGTAPVEGSQVFIWNSQTAVYSTYTFHQGGWQPSVPSLPIGVSAFFGINIGISLNCASNKTVQCGTSWNFDPPIWTNSCSGTNVILTVLSTITNTAGYCGGAFDVTRTWLASDNCSGDTNTATCSQTITVVDTTPPVITCASNKTVQCTGAWTFDNPTAVDACSGTNVTITILSTSTNPLVGGNFTARRIWTIADPCTNLATCTQTVTTVDTTAPVIICPSNIIAAEFPYNSGHAIVTFPGPTVTDCDPSPITNSSPLSGTFFPLGTNTVTWTTADHSGNTNSCAFTIRVIPYQLLVTSTNDSGPGTLRQALLDANDAPGENLVAFNLSGGGGHKIHLLSALPTVTSPVIIDGWSQPGFSGLPVIELEGSNTFDGLVIGAGSSTVRGLALHGFANGLRLETNGNNVIQGNFIGTDLSGTNPLGNSGHGLYLANATAGNLIGGTGTGLGNLIVFNSANGIALAGSAGPGNAILGNSIFTNASLGIDLGNNGVTLNDPGDTDTGPNNYQNFPVLTDAQSENGVTTISGTLNSAANTAFQLDFFLNDSADPSGYGEGQTYLGSATVTTDGNGSNVFSVAFAANAAFTQFITATATDPANNTSEFSQAKQLRTPPVIVAPPTSVTNVSAGTNVTFAVGATNSSQAAQFIYQWRLNGFNIAGATSTSYTTPPAGVTNAGTYTVVVQNDVGAVSVPPVVLTLNVTNVAGADNFANRVPVSGASGTLASNNRNATTQPGEPRHAGKLGGKSVWYTWEAPFNGVATFETRGSTFDTLLAVYTGIVVSNLSVVAYDEDRGGFYTSKAKFNANAGAQYQIAVDGFAGTEGDFVLAWSEENTPHPLPTFLVQPVSQTVGLGSNATFSAIADSIPSLSYQWYFYGLPISGATTSSLTINNVQPTNAGIYTLVLFTPWQTNQSDDASLQINISGSTVQNALAYDKFEDATNAAVMMNITVPVQTGSGSHGRGGHSPGPADAAPAIVTGIIGFGTSSDGTDAAKGETLCGVIGGASAWCPLPPSARAYSGQLYLNTDGSTFNTLLAVAYSSQANILTCDTNSRAGMGVNGAATSAVQIPVRAGDNNNFIGVDGVGGAYGSCTIHWMLFPAPTLSFLGRTPAGNNHLQVLGQTGQSNMHFTIQVSTDFVHWSSLLAITTNSPTNLFDWVDTNSTRFVQRFYRASMLP